jgi:hypothetical protein
MTPDLVSHPTPYQRLLFITELTRHLIFFFPLLGGRATLQARNTRGKQAGGGETLALHHQLNCVESPELIKLVFADPT